MYTLDRRNRHRATTLKATVLPDPKVVHSGKATRSVLEKQPVAAAESTLLRIQPQCTIFGLKTFDMYDDVKQIFLLH